MDTNYPDNTLEDWHRLQDPEQEPEDFNESELEYEPWRVVDKLFKEHFPK